METRRHVELVALAPTAVPRTGCASMPSLLAGSSVCLICYCKLTGDHAPDGAQRCSAVLQQLLVVRDVLGREEVSALFFSVFFSMSFSIACQMAKRRASLCVTKRDRVCRCAAASEDGVHAKRAETKEDLGC